MKNYYALLFTLTFLVSNISSAQNIEFEKNVKNEVDVSQYYSRHQRIIRYEKCFGSKIMRFEYAKVQLLSEQMDVEWVKQFDDLKTAENGLNRFESVFTEKSVYYLQHGSSKNYKNTPVRISRIDEDGTTLTKDWSGIYEMNGVEGMEVVGNNIYIIFNNYEMDGFEATYITSILVIDENLEQVGEVFRLDLAEEGQKYKHEFNYGGYENGQFKFTNYFFKKNNGEFQNSSNGSQQFVKVVALMDDFSEEKSEIKSTEADFTFRETTLVPLKFNKTKYSITVVPALESKSILWDELNPFGVTQLFTSIVVSNGDQSVDLVQSFYDLLGKGKSTSCIFADVMADPINESLSFVLANAMGKAYSFTLTKDLKIAHMQVFKMESIFEQRPDYENLSFSSEGAIDSFGTQPSGYKLNALDYVSGLNSSSFFTIVNYDDYQLLFLDDKKMKTSKVLKIVR